MFAMDVCTRRFHCILVSEQLVVTGEDTEKSEQHKHREASRSRLHSCCSQPLMLLLKIFYKEAIKLLHSFYMNYWDGTVSLPLIENAPVNPNKGNTFHWYLENEEPTKFNVNFHLHSQVKPVNPFSSSG